MPGLLGIIRPILVIMSIVWLVGCTTLTLGTSNQLRAVDYLNDDIASMVMAVDVPISLALVPGKSLMAFSVFPASGRPRQIIAHLERADAAELAATLPAPAQGRGYFLFEFSQEDKVDFRKMQNLMRRVSTGENVGRSHYKVEFLPVFCSLSPVDPTRTTYSVQVVLPDEEAKAPMVAEETVASLLARHDSTRLPICSQID